MSDTRKTTVIKMASVRESGLDSLLRQICKNAQDKASADMILPDNPRDRLIALNTMNNVFDRIDEALEQYIRSAAGMIPVVVEGAKHEREQGVGLAMDTGERR